MHTLIRLLIIAAAACAVQACASGQGAQPADEPAPKRRPDDSAPRAWRSEPDPIPWRTAAQDQRPARLATALQRVVQEAREPAAKGLETFKKLVTEQNAGPMGFGAAADVKRGAIAEGLPVVSLALDELRRHTPRTDPFGLIGPIRRVLVPVTVDGRVRSSIIVEPTAGGARATGFGGPEIMLALETQRARLGAKEATVFVVEAPALNVLLVAEMSGRELRLTPAFDYPDLGLKEGAAAPAQDVLARLADAARQHDGTPR